MVTFSPRFINVANQAMCRPIRSLTQGKGYDARHHRLAAFGGAGGQHACSIAGILDIDEVVIHKYSSILSAFGMALADVVHEALEPSSEVFSTAAMPRLRERMAALQQIARRKILDQNFSEKHLRYEKYLNLRYEGTSAALMIPEPTDGDFEAAFTKRYLTEFSFNIPGRQIIVDDVRVCGIAFEPLTTGDSNISRQLAEADRSRIPVDENLIYATTQVYFEETGRIKAPVYKLDHLHENHFVSVSCYIFIQT